MTNTLLLKTFTAIIFAFLSFTAKGQKQEEYKLHLKSIDSTFYPGHAIDRVDTVFNANRAFVDYTIKKLLKNSSDSKFISNRQLLPKLANTTCDSTGTIITGKLLTGETIDIVIKAGDFDSTKHKIVRYKKTDGSGIKTIDGFTPYGGDYVLPELEIQTLIIKVNGHSLTIPRKAYSNLYQPNICDDFGFQRRIEGFTSLDGNYIYLYIYGGNAGDTYFAKLIFNKEEYLTRIIADYYSLSIHSSFRESFIGF